MLKVWYVSGISIIVLFQWSRNSPIPVLSLYQSDFPLIEAERSVLSLLRTFDTQLQLGLSGIGVSFIDETPTELMYLFLEGVEMSLELGSETQTVTAQIANIQIDVCPYTATFPSLLYTLRPQRVDESSNSQNRTVTDCMYSNIHQDNYYPFLQVSGTRHLNQSNCLHIDKGLVVLQRIVLKIDEQNTRRLIDKFKPFLV